MSADTPFTGDTQFTNLYSIYFIIIKTWQSIYTNKKHQQTCIFIHTTKEGFKITECKSTETYQMSNLKTDAH